MILFFRNTEAMCLFAMFITLTSRVAGQEANIILNKYFDVVSNGDLGRWQEIKSNYIESVGSFSSRILNESTPDFKDLKVTRSKLYRVWPDYFRLDTWEDSVLVSSQFSVHKKSFMGIGKMSPMESVPGPYADVVEFMPLTILKAMKKGRAPKLIGVKEIEGKNYYEIEVLTKFLKWRLFFDETTYLLGYWNNSPDGDLSILTRVFNYRNIDGLLFNMSEYKIKNGIIFYWQEIKVLEIDKDIDKSVFAYDAK